MSMNSMQGKLKARLPKADDVYFKDDILIKPMQSKARNEDLDALLLIAPLQVGLEDTIDQDFSKIDTEVVITT